MENGICVSRALDAFVTKKGYRFSFLTQGEGVCTCADGTRHRLLAGAICLQRPHGDVTVEWGAQAQGSSLFVDSALCEQAALATLLSPFEELPFVQLQTGEQTAFFATVLGDMCEIDAQAALAAPRLLAKWIELMIALQDALTAPQRAVSRPEGRVPEAVMRYVEENISHPISLSDIAGALFISKYHMSHVFKRETGISVGEAVLRRKVEHADTLLGAGVPAHRVSEMVGFNHYSAFFRIYKRIKGHAPTGER